MKYVKEQTTWIVDKDISRMIVEPEDLRKFYDLFDKLAINMMTLEEFENERWEIFYDFPTEEIDRIDGLAERM